MSRPPNPEIDLKKLKRPTTEPSLAVNRERALILL